MKIYGLVGQNLSHSFSRKYFTEKFQRMGLKDTVYYNMEMPVIADLKKALESYPDLAGMNVTIPYKESIFPYLDEIDKMAREIGAVNTIKIEKNGLTGKKILKGYNTDCNAFGEALKPILKPHHRRALILGTGGAAKAVSYALSKMEFEHFFVTRHPSKFHYCYDDMNQNLIKAFQVIINTTPLGTFPNVQECPPIPYEFLTQKHLLFDLVYNPQQTLFMEKGKEMGAFVHNGFRMLKLQAEKSWEIWNSSN